MQHVNYLKPVSSMERISRQYLCDNLDEILDRVDKEDIGFVIQDENGKDGHVLCPYRWMNYCFDEDFGCIVISAIRYAINRHTFMPETVVGFVRKYLHALTSQTLFAAIADIERAINANEPDDPGMWNGLLSEMKERVTELSKEGTEEKQ